MKWDIFISYSDVDSAHAAQCLVRQLRREHFAVWFDKDVILSGEPVATTIEEGLSGSKMAVVFASERFFGRRWPRYELNAFYACGKPILTILHGVGIKRLKAMAPFLAANECIPDPKQALRCIGEAFSARDLSAAHINHRAMIAGGAAGGYHILTQLLAWRAVPVHGIYDMRLELPGIARARHWKVPVFAGCMSECARMLQTCAEPGARGYRYFVFVPTRDSEFKAFMRRQASAQRKNRIDNFVLLWMDDDFKDNCPARVLHELMLSDRRGSDH